jgi:pilus assembly protein Flp/PilA
MTRAVVYLCTILGLVQNRFQDRKDRGATAVEYGLLVGLIAVVIIAAVTLLGTELKALFENIAGKICGPRRGAPRRASRRAIKARRFDREKSPT